MTNFRGEFLWYEMFTTHLDAARDFYCAVIGWTAEPWNDGPKPYTMFKAGASPVGGILQLPEEAVATGAVPHWLGHIGTHDLEATAAVISQGGGKLLAPIVDVPEVGRFCPFADPGGPVASAFQPAAQAPVQPRDTPGSFVWHELWTDDIDNSWSFHQRLWGWTAGESMEMAPGDMYTLFDIDGQQAGGYGKRPDKMPTPAWLYYIHVADLDAACALVPDKGGQVLSGPMDIPGGDRVAHCMDPCMAVFAIHGA